MGVAVAVTKLKSGVVICSVTAGGVNPEGVDACNVANRSGVGVEAAGMLHPASNVIARALARSNLQHCRIKNLLPAITRFSFIFRFNGFKIKFLARYYLRAITAAIGTMNFAAYGMILLETRHTLHLGC